MAILSNINGKFRVDSAGAVYFGTSAGTNGLILKSVGTGGSPVWVDPNTVGTGPWLPIAGGAITGNLTIGGTLGVTGALTGTTASFSGSISASGNSNSFGNTTIAALSASTGTFSASVTAAGNSNSFGTTTFSGGLNVGTYIRTANANTEYNHIQRTSAGYGLYVQQRGTGSIAQFSFGTGSAGSAGTNVLDVTRVGITINGAISLGGIITANAFRTFSTNPDYNLFTRDAAGNTMFIQAAQSNTNQPIAKFSYGSATVNAGTAVLQVSKDNSHFTNCDVGIGTASPDATLDVHAPSTTAPSLAMGAAAGQIFKNEDSELAFGLQNQGPYNVWMQSRFNGNTSRPLLINPLGGNIGIGLTSPNARLDVNGAIKAQRFFSRNGSLSSTAGSYNNVVDLQQSEYENRTLICSVYTNGTHSYSSATVNVAYNGGSFVLTLGNKILSGSTDIRVSAGYLQYYTPWTSSTNFWRITIN